MTRIKSEGGGTKGLKHAEGDVPTCLKTEGEGKTEEYERKEVQRRSSSIKNKKMRTEFISPSKVRTAKEQRYSRSGSLRQKQKESRQRQSGNSTKRWRSHVESQRKQQQQESASDSESRVDRKDNIRRPAEEHKVVKLKREIGRAVQ